MTRRISIIVLVSCAALAGCKKKDQQRWKSKQSVVPTGNAPEAPPVEVPVPDQQISDVEPASPQQPLAEEPRALETAPIPDEPAVLELALDPPEPPSTTNHDDSRSEETTSPEDEGSEDLPSERSESNDSENSNSTGNSTSPTPFNVQLDFSTSDNFRCGGTTCRNSPNIAIGNGRAAAIAGTGRQLSLTSDWVPKSNAMVIYYPFNGDATNERSSGRYSGVANGNVHADQAGKVGNGATFDGSGDFYNTGYARRFSTSDSFSIAAWTKYSGSNQERHIFGAVSSTNYFFEFSIHSSNFYRGYLRSRDNPRVHTEVGRGLRGSTSVGDNRWHHFTFVWDASGSHLVGKVYDDGALAHSQTFNRGSWREIDLSRAPFYLGARNNGGGTPNGYVNGQVDEFGFWTTALNDQEVQEIFSRQSGIQYQAGFFVNATPVTFETLAAIAITATPQCTSFQASPDGGRTFYHKTGGSWVEARGNSDATSATDAAWGNLRDFPAGSGSLVLKMIMASSYVPCTISRVQVTGQLRN